MSGPRGMLGTKDGSVLNVFTNAIYPFSSGKLIGGSLDYVAIEVVVSWLIRRILGSPRSFLHMLQVHTLSLPLMGGAAGFADPPADLQETFGKQFAAGIKGVPAVLTAHWLVQIFNDGFTLPNAGFKEYLITAFAKIMSRPVFSTLDGFLPGEVQDAHAVLHALIERQTRASNFAQSSG